MNYLLDTNILSELRKPKPDKKVISFVSGIKASNIFISCISVGEVQKGISSCPNAKLKKELEHWLEIYLIGELGRQVLSIDNEVMLKWGKLVSAIKNLPIIDSLIAATCVTHGLVLVTRNVKDFDKIKELTVINPFIIT